MSETEKVVENLNTAKLVLCNQQMLTSEMCIRIGQAVTDAITLLKEHKTYDTGESRIFQCAECGYGIDDIFLNSEHDYPIIPIYCPNCGRKVE